jgi:hypothetical protein
MIIQNIMLPLWFFRHTKIQFKKMFPHCVVALNVILPICHRQNGLSMKSPKKMEIHDVSHVRLLKKYVFDISHLFIAWVTKKPWCRRYYSQIRKHFQSQDSNNSQIKLEFVFCQNGNTIPWMKLCREKNLLLRLTSLIISPLFIFCLCGFSFFFSSYNF